MNRQNPVKPKQGLIGPSWWHHHGTKFSLIRQTNEFLQLDASAAKITISRHSDSEGWTAEYEVIHSYGFSVKGKIHMTTDELQVAFGLSNVLKDQFHSKTGQWLLDQYGGDAASQGCFIRYGNFLNIPGPGTAHDGDANVSIELDERIKATVKSLIVEFEQ